MIYSGNRAMTKLSIDVLQPPFFSPGGPIHMLQNCTITSLWRSLTGRWICTKNTL